MPKKRRRGAKDRRIHAAANGTARPLCGAKSAKVSRDAPVVTCEDCGRVAVALVRRAAEGLSERLEAEAVPMGAPR